MRAVRGRSGGQLPGHPGGLLPNTLSRATSLGGYARNDEQGGDAPPTASSPYGPLVIPTITPPSVQTRAVKLASAPHHGSGGPRNGRRTPKPSHSADWLNDAQPNLQPSQESAHQRQSRWDGRNTSPSEWLSDTRGEHAGIPVYDPARRAHTAVGDIADENELPDLDRFELPPPVAVITPTPRPASHRRHLTQQERLPELATQHGLVQHGMVQQGRGRGISRRIADIMVIPIARHAAPRPLRPLRRASGKVVGALGAVARRPMLVSALVLLAMLLAALVSVTGAAQQAGVLSASAWHALSNSGSAQRAVNSGQVVAPPVYDAQHYMDKYGFFQPGTPAAFSSDLTARLATMLPYAIKATTAYNKHYGQSIEPQLLLYWTFSEGIGARINYSDCANEPSPRGKTYFSDIENCDYASFWQLGYGNQFGVIYVLRNAFTDLYGDPNDAQLVAKVGQSVLDYDSAQGTTPPCGGYACAFPAMTIDAILTGVDLTTGVKAEDNWWASVLSRDPLINCYMIAHALTFFNHDATKNWVGCYYETPCWQRDSDKLGDILAAWPSLVKAAGIQG